MATINKNKLLDILKLKPSDKVISIKENGLADANFVITNLMLDILSDETNKMCLVIMHNTVGHYHNVGKRLGFDLLTKVKAGVVNIIEPLKSLYDNIQNNNSVYLSNDKENIVKTLFLDLKNKIDNLLTTDTVGRVYLIIDDVSHFLDLGVDLKNVIIFLKYCTALTNNERLSVIINCHVFSARDEIIVNYLAYISNLNVEVSNLKTGVSRDVSGVLKVTRQTQAMPQCTENIYHYKTLDREIKVFAPGESVFNLRK